MGWNQGWTLRSGERSKQDGEHEGTCEARCVEAGGWWVGGLQNCLMAGWMKRQILDPGGPRWRAKVFC